MRKFENQKVYHFYGGWCTQGHFFIQKGNPEKIFSFGFGKYGELANRESYKTKKAYIFPAPSKISKNIPKNFGKVSKIAKGYYHTLFLMSPGDDAYGVGYSECGSLSVKEKFVLSPILITSEALKGVKIGDIACSDKFSVLLSKNGVPYSCGYNLGGQCGSGTNEDCIYSAIPMKIKEKIIRVDCGQYFTVLLTIKRDVYKTGCIYEEGNVNIPTKLKLNEKVKFFGAGAYHLLVVGLSEQLYGMGLNDNSQLTSHLSYDGVKVLTKITTLPNGNIKDVKCSKLDSYVIMENNDLYGWGWNYYGQSKGDGTVSTSSPWNSTPFKMKSNVEQIEVSAHSVFVFCKEGVYVCGCNENGELGIGNTNIKIYSTLIQNKNLKNIKRIHHTEIIPDFDSKKQIFDIIVKTL